MEIVLLFPSHFILLHLRRWYINKLVETKQEEKNNSRNLKITDKNLNFDIY